MSRAKTRRPSTRGESTKSGSAKSEATKSESTKNGSTKSVATKRNKLPLPPDLVDAAEAALDDLLAQTQRHPKLPPDLPPPDDDPEPERPRSPLTAAPPDDEPRQRPPWRLVADPLDDEPPPLAEPPFDDEPLPLDDDPLPLDDEPLPLDDDPPSRLEESSKLERLPSAALLDDSDVLDESSRLERLPSAALLDDADVVEEREVPELPVLRFAVFEDAANLASAQGAIVAAGHFVSVGASGRDGVARVAGALRNGHGGQSIDAVVVALPGGEAIVDAALALEPRRPVVIASLAGSSVEAVERAVAAGADLATTRPHDVGRMAPLLLAAARLHVERTAAVSARGSEQILRARLDELADADPHGLLPFELFQRTLELEIRRATRFEYPLSVALFAVEIAPPPPPVGIRGILRARAGNALIHTIRDIDLATQLDHERFLVLLPYTDLTGAASVGRRVIAAVAEGDPVVAAGRSFPPRVVGAVAGARPGEPVSFAKLMKNASRALEQARRDGAELAVQP